MCTGRASTSKVHGRFLFEGIIEDFSKAIELDPEFEEAMYKRTLANIVAGRLESAIADLEETLALLKVPHRYNMPDRFRLPEKTRTRQTTLEDIEKYLTKMRDLLIKRLKAKNDNKQLSLRSSAGAWRDT